MKRNSIFFKLFILFIAISIFLVGLLWFLQANFFEGFYERQRINQMKDYSQRVAKEIDENGIQMETIEFMEGIVSMMNGRILILDRRGNTLYQEGVLMGVGRMIPFQRDVWDQALKGDIVIYRVSVNIRHLNTNILSLLYPTEKFIVMFQAPLQPIEESVLVFQQFSVYILIAALLVSFILAGIFARTITKPLVKLNEVAREMAKLNFDVRWDGYRHDEIGQLGETFNFLTDQLKVAFDELKEELIKEKNLDKMRKQFVARVSHEIQTPIALIRGYMEAIQDGVAENQNEEATYFTIMEEEIEKISSMVKDLLDLSQLESGHFKVILDSFEIRELIDHILSKFKMLKNEKDVKLIIEGDDREFLVLGDEYRIEQVLTNLLNNAFKYCVPKGMIKIQIKDLGKSIFLGVFNEGHPIHEKDINNIWESFYKGEENSGTGLGLAIVKNVLELHKSEFGVENVENGVLFYFHLEKAS